MLRLSLFKTRLDISPMFFAVLTFFLILDKNGIALPVIFFSFLHELSHFIIMLILKIIPRYIKLGIFGIQVEFSESSDIIGKCAVYSSGILLNLILAFVFYQKGNYVFFLINLLLGIFSAVPTGGTDGNEILTETVSIFLFKNKEKILKTVKIIFTVIFEMIIVFSFAVTENFYLIIAFIYILVSAIKY